MTILLTFKINILVKLVYILVCIHKNSDNYMNIARVNESKKKFSASKENHRQ